MIRKFKQLGVFFLDLIIINLVFFLCFGEIYFENFKYYKLIFLLPLILFLVFGLYNTTFSNFSSFHFFYILFINVLNFTILYIFQDNLGFNLRTLIIYCSLTIIFFIFFRYLISYFLNLLKFKKKENIIIYGAGETGIKCLKFLQNYKISFFIDDNQSKVGRNISGIKIFSWEQSKLLISKNKISYIYLAMQNLSSEKKREIFNKIYETNKTCIIRFLPNLIKNNNTIKLNEKNFKDLEFEDFFQRSKKFNNQKLINIFKDKRILVTGGAGSIGTELCKQLISFSPSKLVILDNSELNLFNARKKLDSYKKNENLVLEYSATDVVNIEGLEKVFIQNNFDFIFHVAALKHVKIVEENIASAVRTNVFGSVNIINLFKKYNCKKLVYISTDKAVRPTNFMGATKRMSEIFYQNFSETHNIIDQVSIVRFGNVFGSSGSVINIFKDQIESGGPLTITDKKMERYFMSITEAVKLVLFSNLIKKQNSSIFCLDMGESIKIIDIAKKMIFLSGNKIKTKANEDGIEIKEIGKYKSEKYKEELFLNQKYEQTVIENIFIANEPAIEKENFLKDFNNFNKSFFSYDDHEIKKFFSKYIENYN